MSTKEFFGMTYESFRTDLDVKELLDLPGTKGVTERIEYTLKVGGVCAITGEVGIGKSTSLRAAVAQFHPSQVVVLGLIANSGSISELYSILIVISKNEFEDLKSMVDDIQCFLESLNPEKQPEIPTLSEQVDPYPTEVELSQLF